MSKVHIFNNDSILVDEEQILEYLDDIGIDPVFLCVTGSHMWNLARPESDIDIRGIYVEPLTDFIRIHPGRDTYESISIPELGGNVDLQLYEIRKAFAMLLGNNGNIIEMLLSPTAFYGVNPKLKDNIQFWQDIGILSLSKQLSKYYLGYYHSQRSRAAKNRGGKALLYTYREIMAGTVLMDTGRIIHDFYELYDVYKILHPNAPITRAMEYAKNRDQWRTPVTPELLSSFEEDWDTLVGIFSKSVENSFLPDTTDNENILDLVLASFRLEPYSERI